MAGPSPNELDPDEVANPKFRFKYKPKGRERDKKLDPDVYPQILTIIHNLAGTKCTQREAAAMLGVSLTTFVNGMAHDERIRDAWETGQDKLKAWSKQMVIMHAQEDAATARYLANNLAGWSNDPAKVNALKAAQEQNSGKEVPKSSEETDRRIKELQAKLIAPPDKA